MTQSIESMIEVLQAFQAGKKIEYLSNAECVWAPCSGDPLFNFGNIKYRIAPEPKKKVKLVAFIDLQGQLRWIREEQFPNCDLVRVPSEDKEILL